eukprot:6469286-Amphidinium_carterae.1
MVKWSSVQLIISQDVSSSMPLYKLATDWRSSKQRLPNQAQAFTKPVVQWLESMVLNAQEGDASRLLCGRYRLLIGASLRGDDLRRTAPSSLEWLEHNGSQRALLGVAPTTKTGPRQWICSTLGASSDGDGWLEATVALLRRAHGTGWPTDDHLGKAALSEEAWSGLPPVLSKDIAHLRSILAQHGFSQELCEITRTHGAKATIPSLAIHLGLSMAAIRTQGGWSGGQAERMPDRYTRDKQLIALALQEQCLRFWREGGLVAFAPLPATEPMGPTAPSTAGQSSPTSSSSGSSEEASYVMNDKSGVLHKSCDGVSARCNRGGRNIHPVTPSDLAQTSAHAFQSDNRGRVCEVCFADEEAPDGTCEWICTLATSSGICMRRCRHPCAVGFQCGLPHRCDVHC